MADEVYPRIAAKIGRGPLGALKAGGNFSPAFIEYLKLLYAPSEAELVQHLEIADRFRKDLPSPAPGRSRYSWPAQ